MIWSGSAVTSLTGSKMTLPKPKVMVLAMALEVLLTCETTLGDELTPCNILGKKRSECDASFETVTPRDANTVLSWTELLAFLWFFDHLLPRVFRFFLLAFFGSITAELSDGVTREDVTFTVVICGTKGLARFFKEGVMTIELSADVTLVFVSDVASSWRFLGRPLSFSAWSDAWASELKQKFWLRRSWENYSSR